MTSSCLDEKAQNYSFGAGVRAAAIVANVANITIIKRPHTILVMCGN